MTRVLVLTSTFPRWERDTVPPFVLHLSSTLADRGHDVHVLAPHTRGAALQETLAGVQVHRFRYASVGLESLCYEGGITNKLRSTPGKWLVVPIFLAAEFLVTIILARKHRIDLLHAHWVLPQGLVAALAAIVLRRPVLVTAHGTDVLATKGVLRRMLLKFAARRAGACTANSRMLSADFHEKSGVAVQIIPMGVDTLRFCPSASHWSHKRQMRASYPNVLFVGRLVEQKGVTYLIQAMKEVCAQFPQAKLTVVGEGPQESALKKQVEGLGLGSVVEFAGPVANDALPEVYRQSDVVVVPSITTSDGSAEALGVVALEAAACGIPVIATRVGGVPEFIEDRRNGILTPPGDSHAISQGIIELIRDDDLYFRIATEARNDVETFYSWESVAQRFDALIRDVASPQVLADKKISQQHGARAKANGKSGQRFSPDR
jgi:glycosyltransferase involved in cell wall biosynthesis